MISAIRSHSWHRSAAKPVFESGRCAARKKEEGSMKSKDPLQVGNVLEALPSAQYRIEIGGRMIRCYLSGKMRHNKIRVVPGDRVLVHVSGEVGRIERRL